MRTVVCPRCSETIAMPEELTAGFCPRCAQALGASETHLASGPPPALQAFQAEMPIDDRKPSSGDVAIELPERYANWEEFRALSPAIQREMLKLAMTPLPDLRMTELDTLPENVPSHLDAWGKPLGTLNIPGETPLETHVATASFVAIGLIFFISSIVINFVLNQPEPDGQPAWLTVLLFAGIGGPYTLFLVWFTYLRRPSLRLTMWIFEEGLLLRRSGQLTNVRFEGVKGFKASSESGRPVFCLDLEGESTIELSIGHCLEVMPLMGYVEIRMAAAQLLPRLQTIFNGEREEFGAVQLDKEGIHARGIVAPWSEVRRVVSDDEHLFIDWTRRPEWVPIRYRDVSFPHLVMAISHVMIDEHPRLPLAA